MTMGHRSHGERLVASRLHRVLLVLLVAGGPVPAGARPPGPVARTDASAGEEMETDRDTYTFAPTTAGAGRTITELSYSFIDNRRGPEAHSLPELLVRRGIGERLELRVGFNYEGGGPGLVSGTDFGGEDLLPEHESRVLYGTKLETSDQSGWMPMSALVIQGFTPVHGPATQSTLMVGEAWSWRFSNGWEWRSGLRYGNGWEEADSFDQWSPSTTLKIPLGDRWNVHAEYFGITSSGKEAPIDLQYGSIGGHVLLTEDFELGLRVGWGLNDTSPAFFSNLGLGLRY